VKGVSDVICEHAAGRIDDGCGESAGHRFEPGDAETSQRRRRPQECYPAAADEVSALTAAQFATHAQMYQAISAQAAAIHEMFVNTLGAGAGSYAATEAANAIAAG